MGDLLLSMARASLNCTRDLTAASAVALAKHAHDGKSVKHKPSSGVLYPLIISNGSSVDYSMPANTELK